MKVFKTILAILLFTTVYTPIKGDALKYYVYDAGTSDKQEFVDYNSAYYYYQANVDNYNNLVLSDEDSVLMMEYGIVEFINDEACSVLSKYHSSTRNEDDYMNSCYAVDAAYLDTSNDGRLVYFKLAGDIGYIESDDVILHPYNELVVKPSMYSVMNKELYHNVKTQLSYEHYTYSYNIDKAPSFLKDKKSYFSYDGHYFYDDFYLMIDDYRSGEYVNAINSDVYYNYYQYLSYRSLSNYSYLEVEDYFYNTLKFDGKLTHYNDFDGDGANDELNHSQLYGEIDKFFIYQNIYGANALMLIASSINESSYGKSLNAYANNNLYSTSAFDSNDQRNNNRYKLLEESIYAHSKYYISSLYANYLRKDYHGLNFGDKISGISTNYSLDPFYGEKCASTYFGIDKALGYKDYNSLAIGIVKDKNSLNFYDDPNLISVKYSLNNVSELSFVVLATNDKSYKVQIDPSFNDEYIYDFEKSIAYIDKNDISILLNNDKIKENSFKSVSYDFKEGSFLGKHKLDLKVINDDLLNIEPVLNEYEFQGYDIADNKYTAIYKHIESIELSKPFNNEVELYGQLDINKASITVKYQDNKKEYPLSSEMLDKISFNSEEDNKVVLSYCGVNLDLDINVSSELFGIRNLFNECLINKDYIRLKNNIDRLQYPFTFKQIRDADYLLKENDNRNYVIKDYTKRYNLSISGLDLSLDDKKTFTKIEDTYYIFVNDILDKDANKIMDVASGYGFTKKEGIDISFGFNYQDIELKGPAIVQIDVKDKDNNSIYCVYHLDKDGNVVKCKTSQSNNYVQFIIKESGSYLLLCKDSVNEFNIEDMIEDLSYENMGFDNNIFNIKVLFGTILSIICALCFTLYFIVNNKKDNQWKDFKKSLLTVESVQEEKQKN